MKSEPTYFVDLALSRRLERAEGRGSVDYVQARAKVAPESGACWIEVAGADVLFDGVGSPLTQTFGLGMFQPVTAGDLDAIEEFFSRRGAATFHEVSPLADASALALLNERGYRPIEFTSILFRPIAGDVGVSASLNPRIQVRIIRDDEHALWADVGARGWEATGDLAEFIRGLAPVNAAKADGLAFLAELDGTPVSAGALLLHGGVALLAGASTVPQARRQGAQLAMLDARLRFAAARGCDVAMMGATPGSSSQRNAERHGFRIAYTRIKWQLG